MVAGRVLQEKGGFDRSFRKAEAAAGSRKDPLVNREKEGKGGESLPLCHLAFRVTWRSSQSPPPTEPFRCLTSSCAGDDAVLPASPTTGWTQPPGWRRAKMPCLERTPEPQSHWRR